MPVCRVRTVKPKKALLILATSAVLAATLSSCSPARGSLPSPSGAITQYLTAWSHGNWGATARLVVVGKRVAVVRDSQAVFSELGVRHVAIAHGTVLDQGTRASVPVTWTVKLAGLGDLSVHSIVHLRLRARHWKVVFSPATIDPHLRQGSHFVVSTLWAPRAPVLADNGSVLSSEQPGGVEIGVQGSFIKDPAYLEASLLRAGATSSEASTAIAAARASPDTFEPVFAVSTARYGELKATLYPIPGTVFHALSSGTAPPADLSAVVGTLGPITRRQLAALGPPYSATSVVGEGGIEQAEQAALAGSPGGAVTIETSAGHVLATLLRQPPVAPPPLRTSIDPEIQQLATEALSGQQGEAALVAIKASTGQVVAAVNTPALSTEDLALDGEQPPGSTFKVITSTALILHGLTPQSPATCPPSVTVDGEVLHNASPSDAASDMLQAFTVSCNTAYIGLAMANLGDSSLRDAAHLYGLGEMAPLGAVAFPGSVPVAISQTDLAASAIGQGRIVVNPLDLASVAASLDSGTVRAPRLVAGATADKTPTRKLPGDIVSDLHQMMASVVESGTAAGTGLPPGTYAKTGTAEYGTAPPLPVDGWLMGFYGNIAFAMVVIDAHGDGGPVDGPIVARFLDSLSTRGLVAAG